jgi:alkanesulfonate monooxygenase SsuD/methylene tetrahydromethanopterin reductase-like flavin-dependent oxidoreductase (luciferase family)
MQSGCIGRRTDIEKGMAGQNSELFQRYLDEVRQLVRGADELGYASYGHPEHHMQMEGFEITNHPGMFSLFVGQHSKRIKAGLFGYVLPTHNPVRVAEEVATLDHMLQGRLLVGFSRGYQARWFDPYAAVPGVRATTPVHAKARDEQDALNRDVFAESVQVVKKAWENSTFSHKGEYWTFPPEDGTEGHPAYAEYGPGLGADGRVHEVGIAPRCFQEPHPPLYGAFAYSMRSIRMWGREGGKPIVLSGNLDFCETLNKEYLKAATEAGRDVAPEDASAWGGLLILTDSEKRAEAIRKEHDWYYEKWIKHFGQGVWNMMIGTPDQISQRIEDAQKRLKFNEIWLQFSQGLLSPEENLEELERFSSEVAPRFATKDAEGTWV